MNPKTLILGSKGELRPKSLGVAILAEFLGTMFIVIFGCGAAINNSLLTDVSTADLVQISLAFGLVVFGAVLMFWDASGANLNPAVTIGLFAAGKMSLIKGLVYIVAQCLGAIVGALVLDAMTPNDARNGNLGSNGLGEGVTEGQAFGLELITTFVLMSVVLTACADATASRVAKSFAIGGAVTLCHVLSIPYTGCSVNPARSLGPAVITGVGLDVLGQVFWLGPICGALVAVAINKVMNCGKSSQVEHKTNGDTMSM